MSTRLDIISDPVCPWCYLGAANLMRALAGRPEHPFAIRWRPYQLNPDLPPEGMDRRAYMTAKFGDAALGTIHARLEAMGAEAGITYRFDRITRAPNTLDAHRLVHWAAAEAAQTRAAMALFRRYFEAGEASPTTAYSRPPPRRPAWTPRWRRACSPATRTGRSCGPRPRRRGRWG